MLKVNGAHLYYEMAGEGNPLVLLHAGIADCRMWDDQFEPLAQHFRVIRYDARGFGQSEPTADAYYPYEDLRAVMDALEVESAYLVGCSMGGKTILDFALAYPERTAALAPVASDLGGYSFRAWSEEQVAAIEAAEQEGDYERISEIEMQIWFDGPYRSARSVNRTARQKACAMNLKALRNTAIAEPAVQSLEPPALSWGNWMSPVSWKLRTSWRRKLPEREKSSFPIQLTCRIWRSPPNLTSMSWNS
jgi:pimeloyl-ACP methyl ester carboxylesterase